LTDSSTDRRPGHGGEDPGTLKERGGELHLIAGDFNALTLDDTVGEPPLGWAPREDALPTAPRDMLRMFVEAGYTDCFRQLHRRAAGYTYTARWPWLRLDRILASPALSPRCVRGRGG
jgi:exonuclease III